MLADRCPTRWPQPNTGGDLCESSLIPFLVPRRKVWLTPAAGEPCSNATNIENAILGRKVNFAPGKIPSGQEPLKMYTVNHKKRGSLI